MLNILVVFLGGGLGSLCRYLVSLIFTSQKSLATITVNIIGCFLIALVDGILKKYDISFIVAPQLRLLFITGLIGGFTTYSSFLLDFFNHFNDNQVAIALLYLFSSIFLGLCAFLVGAYFSRFI